MTTKLIPIWFGHAVIPTIILLYHLESIQKMESIILGDPLIDTYVEGIELHVRGSSDYHWIFRSAIASVMYKLYKMPHEKEDDADPGFTEGCHITIVTSGGNTYILNYSECSPHIYKDIIIVQTTTNVYKHHQSYGNITGL